MAEGLKGVYSAVATPFTADEKLDEAGLRALIDRTIDGGVHGLVPCGSTGEFSALTRAEREHVVEIVIEQTAGRVPVVPQTGATSTREAIELSRHAEKLGAQAIMVVAPYYEPFTIAETKKYYADIAGSVSIPVMAYNLPAATGVNLTPEILGELINDVPNVKYVKDTSGDFTAAAQLIHEFGDAVSVFVGWDTLFFAALIEGAAGSVIGAANVVPRELVNVYNAVEQGDLTTARTHWQKIFPLMSTFVSGGYNAGIKGGLDLIGHTAGPQRAPGANIDGPRLDALKKNLAALT
ncbi:dihydrodipicolinate synthase family protein [Mycobacterium sp. NAZ190054]|uniref:dihydrodipicolinate synthase family protein n=1 Tax=Mycobacterium sp. NAZ190054 TaxID=1747766 RepID=UPI000796DDB4|nr:dihydrodipicolinate synthase family protein [Mycobacterium sp. NAZ190054]KWX64514.1 4-hydroxy-tetrahydrodipicolinate synthase [Mycobacterium sp. NAZ190054]